MLVRGGAAEAAVLAQVLEALRRSRSASSAARRSAARGSAPACSRSPAPRSPAARAADVLTWLRTPGRLADPDAADALDARVRRAELTTARRGRRRSTSARAAERGSAPSPAASTSARRARRAAAAGAEPFLEALVAEAGRDLDGAAPAGGGGARAGRGGRRAGGGRAAVGGRELRALAAADPALAGGPQELLDALAACRCASRRPRARCWSPTRSRSALAASARVFVCGLQEGDVPAPSGAGAVPRRRARGSRSPAPAGSCCRATRTSSPRERYLLYAAVSRPEEVLFLSFRSSDEEGDPVQPSPFVDDVRALFTDELWDAARAAPARRGHVAAGAAPTPHELRRARAAAEEHPSPPPLGAPSPSRCSAVLAGARDRGRARARDFAGCGVRWLIESVLRPRRDRARPRADAARLDRPRGARAHAARAARARRLGAADPGVAPARRSRSSTARMDELRPTAGGTRGAGRAARARGRPPARCSATRPSPAPGSSRAARVELRQRPATSTARCRWRAPGSASPAASTGSTSTAQAAPLVRDYKGRDGAARRALGAGPAAPGRALRARRARAAGARAGRRALPAGRHRGRPRRAGSCATTCPGRYVNGDVVDGEALEEALDEARDDRRRAADRPAAGRIRACPDACSPIGGCAYPAICRAGEGGGGGGGVTAPVIERRAARAACSSRPSSASRSRTAAARRCSPPTPARARPR